MNRKMYRRAMRCIFSELIRQNRLIGTPEFDIDAPKTSHLKQSLESLDLSRCLLILSNPSNNVQRASSNLKHVRLITPSQINPVDLIQFDKVLVETEVLRSLEEQLQ